METTLIFKTLPTVRGRHASNKAAVMPQHCDALKMLICVEAGIVLTFIFPFEGHLLKWYCQSAFDNSLLCVRISLVSQHTQAESPKYHLCRPPAIYEETPMWLQSPE
ncbi:integrator complex subunit 12 [Platysternon megacephalum]|uniref:Integrator complex subunit 12 n=1 Tax=Platysternon megacephalum TaxID=55544 RepID=A0A4D9FA21_9SAUR|nr:integrator complex subunit 12 [Platysternon megacephalum]